MPTTTTTVFATTDRREATQFILDMRELKNNVVEIKTADSITLVKQGTELPAWQSGPEADWIIVIATPEKITVPGAA